MNKKQFNLAILYNFNSLGNKQDLPNALDESEIVQFLNVEELVNRYQIPCRIVISTTKQKFKYFFKTVKLKGTLSNFTWHW